MIGKKGQLFLIMALVVVVVLYLVRLEAEGLREFGAREARSDLGNSFLNIKDELQKATNIAMRENPRSPTVEAHVNNFSSFVKKQEDFDMFYSVAVFNATILNLTIGNFMDEVLTNITIRQNLTADAVSLTALGKERSNTTRFSVGAQTTDKLVQINVSFILFQTNREVKRSYYLTAGPNFTHATVLYDLTLADGLSKQNDVFVLNYAVNKTRAPAGGGGSIPPIQCIIACV